MTVALQAAPSLGIFTFSRLGCGMFLEIVMVTAVLGAGVMKELGGLSIREADLTYSLVRQSGQSFEVIKATVKAH